MSLCGLITCVSQHEHLLVHLSCYSIIKTKQGPFKPKPIFYDENKCYFFVTDLYSMPHIDDVEDDIVDGMTIMCMAMMMWPMAWSLT